MKKLSSELAPKEAWKINTKIVGLLIFFSLAIVTQSAIAEPPVCDAGGPYEAAREGPSASLQLDGTGSIDPDGDTLGYTWRTDYPGASFDDATSATPILTVDTSTSCSVSCTVTLTLDDVIPPPRV